jgi:hypothetical protein
LREVAAQKTAEFVSTVTAIAAQTVQAAQSSIFSMSWNANVQQSCNFSNCKQDGQEITCENKSMSFSSPINISGIVIQTSGTGKGTIQTCAGCQGDWSAGK